MKRLIDVAVSVVVLVAASPLLVVGAVLVRVSMGRPILFRQTRIGKNDEASQIVKFRTLRAGDGPDDQRATRVGSLLRSLSIDELPQLWNVLRGEMSLVGPRPLLPEYVPLYSERQRRRHDVRPGITGLAQISGRNELGWADRLEIDVRYVETRSLLLVAKILFRTVERVTRRTGVTSGGKPMAPFKGER